MTTIPQSWTLLGNDDRGTDCLWMLEVLPGVLKLGNMCGVVGWDPEPDTVVPHSLLRHSVLLVSSSSLSLALSHLGLWGPDLL